MSANRMHCVDTLATVEETSGKAAVKKMAGRGPCHTGARWIRKQQTADALHQQGVRCESAAQAGFAAFLKWRTEPALANPGGRVCHSILDRNWTAGACGRSLGCQVRLRC